MPSSTANDMIQAKSQNGDESGEGTNLADLILERIAAHEASQGGKPVIQRGGQPEDAVELPAKVVEVYQKSADVMDLGESFDWADVLRSGSVYYCQDTKAELSRNHVSWVQGTLDPRIIE